MKHNMSWLVVGALLAGSILPTVAQDCTELSSAAAYHNRADVAYDQYLYEDVILDETCAIQLDPTVSMYYNQRGNAYYWLEEDARARADYVQALAVDPDAGYVYNNLANLYTSIGDYEQALASYTLAIGADNDQPEIPYTNRASIYAETGKYDLAAADLAAALAENPAYDRAFLALGDLNSQQNQPAKAAENYYQWLVLTETDSSKPAYLANRTYETRLAQGSVERVTLSLQVGDRISISAAGTDNNQQVDPLLVLLDAAGNGVAADDDSGVNLTAVISDYEVLSAGTYTVVLGQAAGFRKQRVDGLVKFSIELKAADGALTVPPPITPAASDSTAVTPVATPVETDSTVSFATFRLFAGVSAEVFTTGGDRLNLRSGPGLRFDILTKLDKGSFVTLIEGPRKQDGLAWWNVRAADGTEGWAVERVDTEQTLQMALIIEEDAYVTSGDETLNVRSAPTRSGDLLFQLENGTRVSLLEAPQLADGFQWWHIRLADGREGWVVDRISGERMLIPASERD